MPGKLITLSKGGKEGVTFPVSSLHVFIGRDPICDLQIQKGDVSPRHCLITSLEDKPEALIRNLSRAHPTLLNGEEIGTSEVKLKSNDVITVCHKRFKWRFDEASISKSSVRGFDLKHRKSWPLSKKLVAIVSPQRRENVEGEDSATNPSRRASSGLSLPSVKKNEVRVLAIKSGLRGARKSTNRKSMERTFTPAGTSSGKKSVKFADSVTKSRSLLGKRGSKRQSETPSSSPGSRGKHSTYFTPSSGRSSTKKKLPSKGILKTPPAHLHFPELASTPSALPHLDEDEVSEGLRTPPKDVSTPPPEVVMRSSKRSAGRSGGPVRVEEDPVATPRSASKGRLSIRKRIRDEGEVALLQGDAVGVEASEKAAKKLKLNPPVAIDKKKMAALLLCHRKSLTPHPEVRRRGRLTPSSTSTPLPSSAAAKSEPILFKPSVTPRALKFGFLPKSAGTTKKIVPAQEGSASFQPSNLEKKFPSKKPSVAKMVSSSSPPGLKMTRSMRAARASQQPIRKHEATDVLSALDLSRKWPLEEGAAGKPTTSPIADLTGDIGIKQLFAPGKQLDVRELFLESETSSPARTSPAKSSVLTPGGSAQQSRRSLLLKSSEATGSSIGSLNMFNEEGGEAQPLTPTSSINFSVQSTSRRSLSLKSSKSLLSLTQIEANPTSPQNKYPLISITHATPVQSDSSISDFTLGSFDASNFESQLSLSTSPAKSISSAAKNLSSLPQKSPSDKLSSKYHSACVSKVSKSPKLLAKKSRSSLRRIAFNTSTSKSFKAAIRTLSDRSIINLTNDTNEISPPLKKRSMESAETLDIRSHDKTTSTDKSVSSFDDKFVNKSTRSNSSVRINLFELNDKPIQSIAEMLSEKAESTTPAKTYVLKTPQSVTGTNMSSAKLVQKSVPVKSKIPIRSFNKSAVGSLFRSKSEIIKKGFRNGRAEVKPFTVKKGKRSKSETSLLDISASPLSTQLPKGEQKTLKTVSGIKSVSKSLLPSSSIHKPTRSNSSVNIDLFKLDDQPMEPHSENVIKTSQRRSISNVSGEKDMGSPKKSKRSKSMASIVDNLEIKSDDVEGSPSKSRSLTLNKSTRSKSTVDIDLFKLDDQPVESLSVRLSNIVVSADLSPRKSEIQEDRGSSKKHKRSKSVGSVHNDAPLKPSDVKELSCKLEHSKLSKSLNKSTRSKSTVDIDLFKLDDQQPIMSSEVSMRKSTSSFTDASIQDSDSTSKKCEMSQSMSSVHNESKLKHANRSHSRRAEVSSIKSRSQADNESSGRMSVPNKEFTSEKSPRKEAPSSSDASFPEDQASTRKNRSSKAVASIVNYFETKISEESPVKLVSPLLSGSIKKSKRSRTTQDVDLSKLDNKPVEAQTSMHSNSKHVEISPRKSLEKPKSPGLSKSTRSKSSLEINLFKLDQPLAAQPDVLSDSLRIKVPPRKSLDKTRSPALSKSTRTQSSVELDLLEQNKQLLVAQPDAHSGSQYIESSPRKSFDKAESSAVSKSTRTKSTVEIDLLKLNDSQSPKKSLSGRIVNSAGRSSGVKSILDRSSVKYLQPETEISSVEESHVDSNKSRSSNKSPEKSHLSENSRLSLNKSTRSRSTIDLNLFKLDEIKDSSKSVEKSCLFDTPEASMNGSNKILSKSGVGDFSSSAGKSSQRQSLSNSQKIENTSVSFREAIQSSFKKLSPQKIVSPSKNKSETSKNKFSRSSMASDGAAESNGSTSIFESPIKTRASKSDYFRTPLSLDNKARTPRSEKTLSKITRSKSSVDIDLFKLEDKPVLANVDMTSNQEPSTSLLNTEESKFTFIASTPAVVGKKSKRSVVGLSPIKKSMSSDLTQSPSMSKDFTKSIATGKRTTSMFVNVSYRRGSDTISCDQSKHSHFPHDSLENKDSSQHHTCSLPKKVSSSTSPLNFSTLNLSNRSKNTKATSPISKDDKNTQTSFIQKVESLDKSLITCTCHIRKAKEGSAVELSVKPTERLAMSPVVVIKRMLKETADKDIPVASLTKRGRPKRGKGPATVVLTKEEVKKAIKQEQKSDEESEKAEPEKPNSPVKRVRRVQKALPKPEESIEKPASSEPTRKGKQPPLKESKTIVIKNEVSNSETAKPKNSPQEDSPVLRRGRSRKQPEPPKKPTKGNSDKEGPSPPKRSKREENISAEAVSKTSASKAGNSKKAPIKSTGDSSSRKAISTTSESAPVAAPPKTKPARRGKNASQKLGEVEEELFTTEKPSAKRGRRGVNVVLPEPEELSGSPVVNKTSSPRKTRSTTSESAPVAAPPKTKPAQRGKNASQKLGEVEEEPFTTEKPSAKRGRRGVNVVLPEPEKLSGSPVVNKARSKKAAQKKLDIPSIKGKSKKLDVDSFVPLASESTSTKRGRIARNTSQSSVPAKAQLKTQMKPTKSKLKSQIKKISKSNAEDLADNVTTRSRKK